jgi:hypothetical protein
VIKKPPAYAGGSVRLTQGCLLLLAALLATLLSTLTGLLARLLVRLLIGLAGFVVALLAGIIILVHYKLLGVRGKKPTFRKGTCSNNLRRRSICRNNGNQTNAEKCRPKGKGLNLKSCRSY